ncbi:tetratricopeptide repeat protein [Pontibacter roseus]|uniref:tetratricopeptide repeat protein n=1 Tax=Pontibacter roseus TaxID=336989 RepID=UPI000374607A|nr:tetratricopeptide repeat protein [Pontibacter roseus]
MVNLEAVVDNPDIELANLNEAIGRSGRDGSLYTRRAMVLLRKGELEQALEDVDQAISLSKSDPANFFVKAQVLYLMGRSGEALPLALQAARNSYQSSSLYVLLAELYLQRKAYGPANQYISKALELSPTSEYAFYYRGRILEETGDTAKALRSYRLALEQNPDFMHPHRELAGLYLAKNEVQLAKPHLQRAEQLAPDDAMLWYYKGLLLIQAQKKDSAFYSFGKAVELADTLHAAHFQLGLLHHGNGDYNAALAHLEMAEPRYGDNIRYLTTKGSSYERLGDNQTALQLYQRAVAVAPNHTAAQQGMARLRYRIERPRPVLDSMAVRQRDLFTQ